ncbi:MAG: hypothetical protein PF503_06265 [Desulfobacula sp.]|jgi:hypothetical protein|nr:hypothetical protein [Desulfobacula sp.]
MKRNSGKTKGKKIFRFYKSNLPAIVWDPKAGKPLADCSKGHFTTEDINVAGILLDKGYPQIPIDADSPPDIIVGPVGDSLKDGESVKAGTGEKFHDPASSKAVLVPQTL